MLKKKRIAACFSDPFFVLFFVTVFAVLLSWIIPSGAYEYTKNSAGQTVVVPGTYSTQAKEYVSLLKLPAYLIGGFKTVGTMLVMMATGGGAIKLLLDTGAIQWVVDAVRARTRRIEVVIVLMTFAMGLLSLSSSITGYIVMTPLFVEIAVALGYTPMLGVAMFITGTAVGFSCGALRPATTAVAQTIAELPLFSGLGFRLVVFVVLMIGSDLVLIRYAKKNRCKTAAAPASISRQEISGGKRLTNCLVLFAFLLSLCIMTVGSVRHGWGMSEFSQVFLVQSAVYAVFSRFSWGKSCKLFLDGVRDTVPVCLLTGFASAVGLILQDAHVLDTVIHGAELIIGYVGNAVLSPAIFVINYIINLFIGAGTPQALVVMPIMVPIADIAELNRQVAVLGYNLGDGLCNYLLPTASSLVGPLALAKLTYMDWMREMRPLLIVWFLLSLVLMVIAPFVWT